MKFLSPSILILCCLLSYEAFGATLRYQGIPLDIKVPTTSNVLLQFVEPQIVGQTKSSMEVVTLESTKSQVLVSPQTDKAEKVKVYFRGTKTGEITMAVIDIGDHENTPRIFNIRTFDESNSEGGTSSITTDNSPTRTKGKQTLVLDDRAKLLIRHVNQAVNKERGVASIIEPIPFAVKKINTRLDAHISGFYRKGLLNASLVDVYQGGGLTALLVVVENVTTRSVSFDPTQVRGKWHSVQPWKVKFSPKEKGVLVMIAQGGVPETMMHVMSKGAL